MQAISDQACKVLHLFGKDGERVATTVGPEQEYFPVSYTHLDVYKRQLQERPRWRPWQQRCVWR